MKPKVYDFFLKIPGGENFGSCDLELENAMDIIARQKGYKNRKFWLKKEFGCSGHEVKLMTRRELNPGAVSLDPNKHPLKDAYRFVRKINVTRYPKVIAAVVKEFTKMASLSKKEDLLKHIKDWDLYPPTYEQVFCHPIFKGFKTVERDEPIADYINRHNNTRIAYESLIKELSNDQTEIKL